MEKRGWTADINAAVEVIIAFFFGLFRCMRTVPNTANIRQYLCIGGNNFDSYHSSFGIIFDD